MQHTELTYFKDPFLYENDAIVCAVQEYEGRPAVVLDQTIFYPQGGGQPYDQGKIMAGTTEFTVAEVRFKEGIVYHIGTFVGEPFATGTKVKCIINKERRTLHSRLHSGGHLIDMALAKFGHFLKPHKGYHFPEGPYVEYEGESKELQEPLFKEKLEKELAHLIAIDAPVKMECKPLEEIKKMCRFVPDFLPPNKPTRIVTFSFSQEEGDDMGIPCGGTHVPSLKKIGIVTIHKITVKKGITRISYRCI